MKFEIAFGKNGWVWIQSNNEENLMIIINALKLVSENSEEEVFQTMLSMLKI